MNNITVELTSEEQRHIIKILQDRYDSSLDIIEISSIKSILEKLDQQVNDWVPSLQKQEETK